MQIKGAHWSLYQKLPHLDIGLHIFINSKNFQQMTINAGQTVRGNAKIENNAGKSTVFKWKKR